MRAALGLLRRHVGGRAEDRLGSGQLGLGVQHLGQAEIGDLGRPIGLEQDVRRLEISVDDPFPMGFGDGPSEDFHQPGGLHRRPRPTVQHPVETASGQVFQFEKGETAHLSDVVDLHDAGMTKAGDRVGLGTETRAAIDGPACWPARIIFRAQGRFRAILRARYTTPMPPRPSSPSIS